MSRNSSKNTNLGSFWIQMLTRSWHRLPRVPERPLSQPQFMHPLVLPCAQLCTASFSAGSSWASQCSRSYCRCRNLPVWLLLRCRGPRSQDKRRRKSKSGHGTGAGQSMQQSIKRPDIPMSTFANTFQALQSAKSQMVCPRDTPLIAVSDAEQRRRETSLCQLSTARRNMRL
jgi:hypothetical protein